MEEIGRRLRSAREAMGVTLEQAEQETKIRRKYLEALETAHEADIPGEVYLKGFLRTYGNYVGLDGTDLVEEYKQARRKWERQIGAAREEQGSGHAAAGAAAAMPGSAQSSSARPADGQTDRLADGAAHRLADGAAHRLADGAAHRLADGGTPRAADGPAAGGAPRARPLRERPTGPAARNRPQPRRPAARGAGMGGKSGKPRSVPLSVVALALLAAVGFVGWLIFRPGPATNTPPPPPPPTTVEQPKPTDPAPKLPDPPKVVMTKGTGEDVIFTVPAKEIQVTVEPGARPVWLQAQVDGKVVYEATGSKPVEVKGTKIKIRAGHMDGVSLIVNGQRFEKPLDTLTHNLIFNGQ